MTVSSWLVFCIAVAFILPLAYVVWDCAENDITKFISVIIAIALIAGAFFGLRWYHTNTASGQRALVDQNSNFGNGLERTVTIYTANGDVIAQYTGKIDIEGNDGGYLLFDFEGKRYTYYNCFVESIADIG